MPRGKSWKKSSIDEDRHIDGIEEVQDEIQQMGIQVFLSTQLP